MNITTTNNNRTSDSLGTIEQQDSPPEGDNVPMAQMIAANDALVERNNLTLENLTEMVGQVNRYLRNNREALRRVRAMIPDLDEPAEPTDDEIEFYCDLVNKLVGTFHLLAQDGTVLGIGEISGILLDKTGGQRKMLATCLAIMLQKFALSGIR